MSRTTRSSCLSGLAWRHAFGCLATSGNDEPTGPSRSAERGRAGKETKADQTGSLVAWAIRAGRVLVRLVLRNTLGDVVHAEVIGDVVDERADHLAVGRFGIAGSHMALATAVEMRPGHIR